MTSPSSAPTAPSQRSRAPRGLLFDPVGDPGLDASIGEVLPHFTRVGTVREVLEICSLTTEPPGVLIVREREGYAEEYRRLFEQLSAMHAGWALLYLYGPKPLYAAEFHRYGAAFLPYTERELFLPTLQSFVYGHRFKEGLRHARKRVRMLEEKIANIGKSYHREREELERAMELKETWFASMVHELRTPVNGILGLSHLLAQSELDEEQRQRLKKIESSGDILLGLVNDLLDFTKLDSGKMELEEIEFDLNEVLDRVAAAVGFQAEAKGLRLIFDIDRLVPAKVVGDPLRLSQVLINLLNNAVKFTARGEILLKISMRELDRQHGTLLFEVIDTGIGMDDAQRRRLFGSFAQADASVSRKYGGTGLGLMISKELIGKMGGEIGVESTPGKGSRFYFTVPTRRTERRSYRLPSKALMYKRVLILDASPSSAQALARMFRYFHYKTTLAATEEERERALEKGGYDIVIVDESLAALCSGACRRSLQGARFVALRSDYATAESRREPEEEYDAVLKRPLTQQKIFRLILELYQPGRTTGGEGRLEELRRELRKRRKGRILIADDNAINQAVIMGLLSTIDFQGVLAGDGEEVLEILERGEEVDLILMDLHMPRMRGDEAARRIRRESRYDAIPIVALSADRIQREMLGEMEMQASLAKPIDVERFYSLLAELLPAEAREEEAQYYMAPYGFDVEEGVERAGGNHPLYCRLLRNFLQMALQSCREIGETLLRRDRAEAARQLRIINSASYNLRATTAHDKASAILESLTAGKLGDTREQCRELSDYLKDALQRVGEGELLKRSAEKREAGAQKGTKKLLATRLGDLSEAVRERRLYHCEQILEDLGKYWWEPKEEKRINDLQRLFRAEHFAEMERYLGERAGEL